MSLANNKTFTIGDLSKIALGAEELTHECLYVLQNLFLALLHKLGCHNETVKIKGLAGKCLQMLLNDYPIPCQYDFQFENVQNFQKKYEILEELEGKAQEIDTKIKQHIQEIRDRIPTNIFSANHWHVYASPTEDLGALCLKETRNYWFLAEHAVFNSELRKRVVPKVMDKLQKFEDRIEVMRKQLEEITNMADETTAKLECVKFAINDTEDLRSSIMTRETEFCEAIAEVDEMLSCKLHRVTAPALKKYLEKRVETANRYLRALQLESKKCPSTKPLLIEDKKTCLSCSRHRDLKHFKTFKNIKSIDENVKCSCCNVLKDPSIIEKIKKSQSADLTALDPCTARKSE